MTVVVLLLFHHIPLLFAVGYSCASAPDPGDADEAGTAVATDVIDPSSLSSSSLVVELSCPKISSTLLMVELYGDVMIFFAIINPVLPSLVYVLYYLPMAVFQACPF